MRPALRLPYHRGTTAHLASLYPFCVQGSFGSTGPYVGVDVLAGGAEFCWDPFDAYATGLVTNPNCWILGEPGNGKSALVKCLLWRMAAVYGTGRKGRWIAIADPKGEYAALAHWLGLSVIRLSPGGATRINPLDDAPGAANEPIETRVLRRAELVSALVATVLARPLTQLEDAAVFAAIEQLTGRRGPTTLADLLGLLSDPDRRMTEALRRPADALGADLGSLRFALDKLLSRSLRGMFDGPSTVAVQPDGPGIVLDLSAVPLDSEGADGLIHPLVVGLGWT